MLHRNSFSLSTAFRRTLPSPSRLPIASTLRFPYPYPPSRSSNRILSAFFSTSIPSVSTESDEEKKQRIKKVISRGSLLALITVLPLFYWLQSKINQKRPKEAEFIDGTWIHIDKDGSVWKLRFNKYNMAKFETADNDEIKGSITCTPTSFVLSPMFFGDNLTFEVNQWPDATTHTNIFIVDGRTFRRQL